MPSAADLIEDVLAELEGSLDEEQATTLAAPIGPTDLSFTVTATRGQALGISPGVIEIDSELMYVSTVDDSGCAIEPWGRGYKRTIAASHDSGARVVSQPSFPRAKVLDSLNQTLGRVFPMVWQVKSYEATTTVPVRTYDLPDDAQTLLVARWQVPDGSKSWVTVNRTRVSAGGGTMFGDGLNGITIDVADPIPPGRPIQFLYSAKPGLFTSEDDDLETATGLPVSMRDVIVLGAVTQLLPSQELSRLQLASVEQQNRSGLVAPAAALTSSRYLEQKFQARLLEERKSLQRLYAPRISGVWK